METIFAAPAFFSVGIKMENTMWSCVGVPKTTLRFDDSPQNPEKLLYSWLWVITDKGCRFKSAKEKYT